MKKLSVLLALVMLLTVFATTTTMAQNSLVKICVNGIFIHLDTDPVMDSGSVFVPIRLLDKEMYKSEIIMKFTL